MAVYVSVARRRRRTVLWAIATLVIGLLVGFAVGTTRTKSVDDRVQSVHADADQIAARLVALDIEYRDALGGGSDDFDTSVIQPLGKIQSDAVHLLDRAAWINPDQRGEVLDELAKLVVLAKARTAADEFLAALNDAASSVRSTFGVSSRRG
jgi:hypothetical protein